MIATPNSKTPTVDDISTKPPGLLPWDKEKVLGYLDSIREQLNHPASLEDIHADDFDIIFYPGGHGPMEDLSENAASGTLLAEFFASGKPTVLLCHGPAAMLATPEVGGVWPFKGYRMTALSNIEEKTNPFSWKAKWLLQDALEERGADYHHGLPMVPHIEVDRNLYTGQNPYSSHKLATAVIEAVKGSDVKTH